MTDVWEEELGLRTKLRGCLITSLVKAPPTVMQGTQIHFMTRLTGTQSHKHKCVRSSHTQKLSLHTAMTYLWQQQGVDYFGDCGCYDSEQVTDMQTILPLSNCSIGFACIRNPVSAGCTHYVHAHAI